MGALTCRSSSLKRLVCPGSRPTESLPHSRREGSCKSKDGATRTRSRSQNGSSMGWDNQVSRYNLKIFGLQASVPEDLTVPVAVIQSDDHFSPGVSFFEIPESLSSLA